MGFKKTTMSAGKTWLCYPYGWEERWGGPRAYKRPVHDRSRTCKSCDHSLYESQMIACLVCGQNLCWYCCIEMAIRIPKLYVKTYITSKGKHAPYHGPHINIMIYPSYVQYTSIKPQEVVIFVHDYCCQRVYRRLTRYVVRDPPHPKGRTWGGWK